MAELRECGATRDQRLALVQLPLTLLVLAFVPSNGLKLGALLVVWAVTFRHLERREWLVFAAGSVLFTVMDALSVRQGVFAFTSPDALGLPVWEFVMWGFWLVHGGRVLRERGAAGGPAAVVFALLFALAFPLSPSSQVLLVVTSALLGLALVRFHERGDLLAVGYFVVLGALTEAVGVRSGLWSYPATGGAGFPLWFATMWGGVGLLLRRLVLPGVFASSAQRC